MITDSENVLTTSRSKYLDAFQSTDPVFFPVIEISSFFSTPKGCINGIFSYPETSRSEMVRFPVTSTVCKFFSDQRSTPLGQTCFYSVAIYIV